jgi:isocitrate dehydrogenase (NAD+)
MLNYLGEREAAAKVDAALIKVYREGKYTTKDVGGKAGTKEFTDAVIKALK